MKGGEPIFKHEWPKFCEFLIMRALRPKSEGGYGIGRLNGHLKVDTRTPDL